jgi:uncharacterized protein
VTRLLLLLAIGVLVYLVLRPRGRSAPGRGNGAAPAAEDIVRCRVCGLNLPKSEALRAGGGWACCADHARAADSAP